MWNDVRRSVPRLVVNLEAPLLAERRLLVPAIRTRVPLSQRAHLQVACMKLETRTTDQLNQIANSLMQQGSSSPRAVRLQLQREGIHWSYSVQAHPEGGRVSLQSTRECSRRLRQRDR